MRGTGGAFTLLGYDELSLTQLSQLSITDFQDAGPISNETLLAPAVNGAIAKGPGTLRLGAQLFYTCHYTRSGRA